MFDGLRTCCFFGFLRMINRSSQNWWFHCFFDDQSEDMWHGLVGEQCKNYPQKPWGVKLNNVVKTRRNHSQVYHSYGSPKLTIFYGWYKSSIMGWFIIVLTAWSWHTSCRNMLPLIVGQDHWVVLCDMSASLVGETISVSWIILIYPCRFVGNMRIYVYYIFLYFSILIPIYVYLYLSRKPNLNLHSMYIYRFFVYI